MVMPDTELWGVDAPRMKGAPNFAVIVRNGIVVQAAPYARRFEGQTIEALARWFRSKGAKVELLRPAITPRTDAEGECNR